MPAKVYRVTLTIEERKQLTDLVNKGGGPAGKLRRARILLLADEAQELAAGKMMTLSARCNAVGVWLSERDKPVQSRVLRPLSTIGQPKTKRSKVLDSAAEARLVQLACSQAPDGRERWTLQLLADKLIELEVVEIVSYETVRTTLKK
jgi:hypothetical protein